MSTNQQEWAKVIYEITLIAKEWYEYWPSYQRRNSSFNKRKQLASGIKSFVNIHLRNQSNLFERSSSTSMAFSDNKTESAIGMELLLTLVEKAVPMAKTHNAKLVRDTLTLMSIGKEDSVLPINVIFFIERRKNSLNTKQKRFLAFLTPFLIVLCAFKYHSDLRNEDEVSFAFMVLVFITIMAVIFSFTRLPEWIKGGS